MQSLKPRRRKQHVSHKLRRLSINRVENRTAIICPPFPAGLQKPVGSLPPPPGHPNLQQSDTTVVSSVGN